MKVKVLKEFRDKHTKVLYKVGEILTISKERKAEIDQVSKDFVEEIAPVQSKKASK